MHAGSNSSEPLSAVDFKDFPYLRPGEMDEDEFSFFLNQLRDETRDIKGEFSSLLLHLKKDMEATAKLEDVVSLLLFNIQDDGFEKLMESCKNLADVFRLLFKYISFFDFYLVTLLTYNFSSTSTKKKLKRYKKKFQDYCKRRICECPEDTFSGAEKSDKIYKIKTDKILESYTLEDLGKLQYEIQKILGRKLLHLLKIKDGCVRLTFRVVNDDHLVISEKQKLALCNLGVISVTCGSKIICSDIISDSGYHSKSVTETSTEKSSSKIFGGKYMQYTYRLHTCIIIVLSFLIGKGSRKIPTESRELFSFAKVYLYPYIPRPKGR